MTNDEEKYRRIIEIIRKSRPLLNDAGEIEEKVMGRIQNLYGKSRLTTDIFDFLFGWVYIGWIRKGLVAASILVISLFAWQQSLILKRINSLEKQTVLSPGKFFPEIPAGLDEKLMLYKITGRKSVESITISERQLDRLLRSYNDLQVKYEDLLKLIEDDPDLKQYIKNKLSEKTKRKFNL